MVAWGDIAVGERRGVFGQPSKSGVLGMVGAALGIRREDDGWLKALHAGYGFACKVDRPGTLLTDYHTVQTVPAAAVKRIRIETRRGELSIPRHKLVTILSSRDYLCDGVFSVALWTLDAPPAELLQIQSALRQPAFSLYLGRRCCPPGLPLNPQLVDAPSPTESLRDAKFGDEVFLAVLGMAERARFHWEGNETHLPPLETVRRRDRAGSRQLWQFGEREEHLATEGR